VKIPSESDGLNEKVRLCVNVQLDLDLEVDRNSDLDAIMLRIRDRIHSIASIVSSNSTSPCLLHNGEPVAEQEQFKNMLIDTNSVNLILK